MTNYLVILESPTGELEKILSGMKTMLIKEFDPAQTAFSPINPGDSLYFLRNENDCALRVKATVTRVLIFPNRSDANLSHTLKEMQPRLQLTEAQYNYWSAKEQALLVEFESAQKIGLIHIAPHKITGRMDWIAFEAFSSLT